MVDTFKKSNKELKLEIPILGFLNNIKPIFNLLIGFDIEIDYDNSDDYRYLSIEIKADKNSENLILANSFSNMATSLLDLNYTNVYTSNTINKKDEIEIVIHYDLGVRV